MKDFFSKYSEMLLIGIGGGLTNYCEFFEAFGWFLNENAKIIESIIGGIVTLVVIEVLKWSKSNLFKKDK